MFGTGLCDEDITSVWIIRLKPYKLSRVTSFFIVPETVNEETTIQNFSEELKKPKYGVINAHIGNYDFGNPMKINFDGINCTKYESCSGDILYIHRKQLFGDFIYLGSSN